MALPEDPVGRVTTGMPLVCGCFKRGLPFCVLLLHGLDRVGSLHPKSLDQPGVLVACAPCSAHDPGRSYSPQLFGLKLSEGFWHKGVFTVERDVPGDVPPVRAGG